MIELEDSSGTVELEDGSGQIALENDVASTASGYMTLGIFIGLGA